MSVSKEIESLKNNLKFIDEIKLQLEKVNSISQI